MRREAKAKHIRVLERLSQVELGGNVAKSEGIPGKKFTIEVPQLACRTSSKKISLTIGMATAYQREENAAPIGQPNA
jgi:hypothetical protein